MPDRASARPAHRRFRSRPQFQALLRRRPVAHTRHFALHHLPAASDGAAGMALFLPTDVLWLDALVPKRWARRAVQRNLIRRQIHVLGAQQRVAGQGAWLVRLRRAWTPARYPSASSTALKRAVRAELLELLAWTPGPV